MTGSIRAQGQGRGIPSPYQCKFCQTCYDNEQGKSTYLLHNTNENNCPTKLRLNAIINDFLPQEIQEEQQLDIPEEQEEEDNNSQMEYKQISQININSPGLSILQPVSTQLLKLTDCNGSLIHLELESATTVNYITLYEAKRNAILRS